MEYKNSLLVETYDVVVQTETWLSDDIADGELFDNNYANHRKDRDLQETNKKRGEGKTLFVKLNAWGNPMIINALYFPPQSKVDELHLLTEPNTRYLFLGDNIARVKTLDLVFNNFKVKVEEDLASLVKIDKHYHTALSLQFDVSKRNKYCGKAKNLENKCNYKKTILGY
ncbi:hypothetical protein JTB14_020520 [Gonioctena quinquepunctata]|nr:hypothetical protein JTB14_020520 [Gonioctena quinquepunctata]